MSFPQYLKRWFGYTRRERTGSLILCLILFTVIVYRFSRGYIDEKDSESQEVNNVEIVESNTESVIIEPDLRHENIQSGLLVSDRYKSETGIEATKKADEIAPVNPPVNLSGINRGTGLRTISTVNINEADSSELEGLPALGPVLSARIIKYRELLGGFTRWEQLGEVYGLKSEALKRLEPYIMIDSNNVRKININTANYRELLRHPYITESQVKSILDYRSLAGPFTDIKQLVRNRIFSPDEFEKICLYLVTTE